MKRMLGFAILGLMLLIQACAAIRLTPIAPAPTAAPAATFAAKPKVLHIEIPEDADLTDLPRLMAADTLKEQGYTIEPVSFADTALTIAALQQGALDITNLSNVLSWTAMQQGLLAVALMDDAAELRLVAVTPNIKQCSDLNGKSVAMNSLSGTPFAMLNVYIERHCPGTKPNLLVVQSANARLAALKTNKLDAAVVDLVAFSQPAAPGETPLHQLMSFHEEYPNVKTIGTYTRRDFAKQYPETVKDYIRAILQARRKIQDPQVFADELVKRFKMEPTHARQTADLYLQKKIWDLNGGYTPEVIQETIDFFVKIGALKPGLQAKDISDLSYLNAVLDEIGRKE
ncbi:MAG TPA: ABC transporter substrate-binding protein [Anaerolineae bacterium]|nr:ABC transporter substrate-binding protein [Anaerolineae bacterium]